MEDKHTLSLIEKLDAEKVDYAGTKNPEDAAYNLAIEHCIQVVRQHTAAQDVVERVAKALPDVRWLPISISWEYRIELAKAAIAAIMGDASTRKDEELVEEFPACDAIDMHGTSPASDHTGDLAYRAGYHAAKNEQQGEIPVLAGFVIDLANSMEAALKNSDGNYCEASMEVFNFIHPYLRTTEPVSVERCAVALKKAVPYPLHEPIANTVKAVLDAAKAQGARFDYVD